MEIAFFVPRCTTDNSHGHYVIELAVRLARNHRVEVYSGAVAEALRTKVVCRLLPIADRPAILRLATLWTMGTVATTVGRRFHIVHVQGADAPIGNIVTAHYCNAADAGGPRETRSWSRRLNATVGSRLERYCFTKPSTKRVIAVSRDLQEQIVAHYGIDPLRVRVIHHGVDSSHFSPPDKVLRRAVRGRIGLKEDDFVALFVGGDYQRKGLPVLLKAIEKLDRRTKLLVIGVEWNRHFRALIGGDDLERRVVVVGRTDDMVPYYAAADCFVLPTRYDTFSLATLEAMACGLPVIVSRAAGVSEILTDGVDSIVLERPEDGDALSGHLSRLADDERLRAGLGEQARRLAEQHSWDNVVEQTQAVYREAATS